MKITNKHNLPSGIYNAIAGHKHKSGFISASQMTSSAREFWLKRRHSDEIIKDASQMIWSAFGTAFHSMVEKNTTQGISEKYLTTKILGETFSGACDLYDNKKVTDYKTTSVWTIIYNSRAFEWECQLNCYAYLYRMAGYEVDKLEIVALLRDWTQSKAEEDNYPSVQIVTIPVKLWDIEKQEDYITSVIEKMQMFSETIDTDLPFCDDAERWKAPTKYAVMEKGKKRALKLYDNLKTAETHAKVNDKFFVETRESTARKCKDYCDVYQFCNQYKEEII